jgi:hypothetical protein
MTTTSELSESLRQILLHPSGGIVGLVDDLLILCRQHGMQLDWHVDGCRVRFFDRDGEDSIALPRGKSIFRAILARVAVLCNERKADSVSPYGGEGELLLPSDPLVVIKVAFTNTTSEQRLELLPQTSTR